MDQGTKDYDDQDDEHEATTSRPLKTTRRPPGDHQETPGEYQVRPPVHIILDHTSYAFDTV